jgi:hypothetical protein
MNSLQAAASATAAKKGTVGTCTIGNSLEVLSSNVKKAQNITLPISLTNYLPLDYNNKNGTSLIKVTLTYSIGSVLDYCDTDIINTTCTYTAASKSAIIALTSSANYNLLKKFNLRIKASKSQAITGTIAYTVDIKIGNNDGSLWIWGSTVDGTYPITWETCSGANIQTGGAVPVYIGLTLS